jgi:hypothetical protein
LFLLCLPFDKLLLLCYNFIVREGPVSCAILIEMGKKEMKHLNGLSKLSLIVLAIGLLVLAYGAVQAISRQAPHTPIPSPPTPTPASYTPHYVGTPPTNTPRPGEVRPPAKFSTPTPLPISRIIDLAPGLPDEDKYVLIVRRSNGKYEQYIIPINRWLDAEQLIGLGPQDVIIYENPLVPLPHSTPPLTPLFLSPISTPSPYP